MSIRAWHITCTEQCDEAGPQNRRSTHSSARRTYLPELRRFERIEVSNTESLVVVKLDHNGGQAPLVFEVLEQAGLLAEVSENELEMAESGAVGFRVPRDRMEAVVLALECNGFANVRAYEVQP
jgi:hypothetical protein